jgi:hypothetical protein
MRFFFVIFILIGVIHNNTAAQSNPNDSIECLKAISIYRELSKMNYDELAYSRWQMAYQFYNCNKKRLLSDGENFLIAQVKNEKDEAQKQNISDSLLILYDDWAKISEDKEIYFLKKALAIYNFAPRTESNLLLCRQLMQNSLEKLNHKFPVQAAPAFFYTSERLYESFNFPAEKLYADYLQLLNWSKENKYNSFTNKLYEELVLLKSPDWNAFYLQLAKKRSLQQQMNIMLPLAEMSLRHDAKNTLWPEIWLNEQSADSLKELDKSTFSQYYFILSNGSLAQNDLKKARSFAEKSLEYQPENAMSYYLLGEIYSLAAQTETTDFLDGVIYCLAADKYKEAAAINPALKDSVDIKIKQLQNYFPKPEDAFFKGIQENSLYQFTSWINDSTKIRFR